MPRESIEKYKRDEARFNELVACLAGLLEHRNGGKRIDLKDKDTYQELWDAINHLLANIFSTPALIKGLDGHVQYLYVSRIKADKIPNLGDKEHNRYRAFIVSMYEYNKVDLEKHEGRSLADMSWPKLVDLLKRFPLD